ncbi:MULTISPECIES: low molecular weight protein-tyrosine-phosphatase [Lysinibacillus]|uniref:low molecular weight protein-tyrosine-phosphatase n=1 Tax=Lysinibacillus TaxID=400634 RepID=UPI001C8CE1E4|nr:MULTISPECIES: low molecular weight protein-tyrosine-phosphatase [Lysinibacillus]MBX8945152.1 low molecular weight phosphotyrosine protein phosphatase [Lysinibacillus sp. K60]UUV24148.1 low molecular weight phosphotyrosine protein phosphatase [Lysinibacillus sp. FN11]UYB47022.1 low molecular weight phosphotyrosine protein phosphatase [Lysinibacillus capsici]
MIRVLFVCLGNICRSPMAEAVMRDLVKKEHLEDKIEVDSAATSSWHIGEPPHRGTQDKLREYGISTIDMQGRQLQKSDFEEFAYIIGMDESNIRNIRTILGHPNSPKIFRFLDLTAHRKDVPDPYYTGDFQETYELVQEGCQALLAKIKQELL